MTDDIKAAFGSLEDRAIAAHLGDPLDRICVRDFTKDVEIGAFQVERDRVQGIRFNVVLEVPRSAAADFDDVDQVLSYDTITEAIEEQLAFERLNLLETLAERIAQSILVHPRAVRVFVRIEKLDRIPGTLGIEIVRSKNSLEAAPIVDDGLAPMIIFMPNSVLHGPRLDAWLNAIAADKRPAIICLEPVNEPAPITNTALADLHIGLMSIAQNAWVLAAKDARCVVVDNRTELGWAMKNRQLSVWSPPKIVLDAVEKPKVGANDPLALAQWFAQEFFTDRVYLLETKGGAKASERLSLVATPGDL